MNIGIGMPIFFHVKIVIGMRIFGDAYFHLTPVNCRLSVNTASQACHACPCLKHLRIADGVRHPSPMNRRRVCAAFSGGTTCRWGGGGRRGA